MQTGQHNAIEVVEREGKTLLILQGTVDVASAEQLHNAACQVAERRTDVAVECGPIEHIDLSALQILLALQQALHAQSNKFRLQNIPAVFAEQCKLAGLSQALSYEVTEI